MFDTPEQSVALLFLSSPPDPTRIIEPPQDLKILRGTTAQFICQAEYDRSLRREIEILWARDGEEAYLNYTQDARYECHTRGWHSVTVQR